MNKYFLSMLLLSMFSIFAMENTVEFKFDSSTSKTVKPKSISRKIGNYIFTGHALDRMEERNITPSDIVYVINNNVRHHTLQDSHLVADVTKKIGVIVDFNTNTIVTAIPDFGQERLEEWLNDRDSATPEERKAAKEKALNRKRKNKKKPTKAKKTKKRQDVRNKSCAKNKLNNQHDIADLYYDKYDNIEDQLLSKMGDSKSKAISKSFNYATDKFDTKLDYLERQEKFKAKKSSTSKRSRIIDKYCSDY